MPESLKSVLVLLGENDVQEVIDYLDRSFDNYEIIEFLMNHFEL